MRKRFIVDSDAIFALYNPDDLLNNSALVTFNRLAEEKCELVYPSSVIFETMSLFQRVLANSEITTLLHEKIQNDELKIYFVEEDVLKDSLSFFKPKGSKKNTLVDCSVVAIAKKLKADGVFSYDEFYKKNGLKLASELVNPL
ncbi:MAG: hypothetical protein AAB599_02805 [Patescibacteria group bacterium]